jgi:hypothetical protein
MTQSREYLTAAKRKQRETLRAAGLCILSYKGCAHDARPKSSTCQNCADKTARALKRRRKAAKHPPRT